MIKCKTCKKDADELLYGIPYCKFHFDKIVKQKLICPICGEIFRTFDDKGNHIDGTFATMHDECYERYIDNPEIEWKCLGGKVE